MGAADVIVEIKKVRLNTKIIGKISFKIKKLKARKFSLI